MPTWMRIWMALGATIEVFLLCVMLDKENFNSIDWRDVVVSVGLSAFVSGVVVGLVSLWIWALP